jgi:NitT/TauT family transport system permease protein
MAETCREENMRKLPAVRNIKFFLPIIGVTIVCANYYLMPNVGIIRPTWLYPVVLAVFLAAYVLKCAYYMRDAEKMRTYIDKAAPKFFGAMLLLALYDYATLKSGILPMPYFPWPDRILNVFPVDWRLLGLSVAYSMRLLFLGYLFGAFSGLVCGILIGWFKMGEYWIMPVVRRIGPVPAIVWIPIVMMLAPTTLSASIFLVALAVWFPMTLMTSSGILGVRNAYFEVAKTLGADEFFLVFKVALPAALPHIFLGLFQGMGVACVTLISAEMMGVKAGLGWYITNSTAWAEYNKVFAGIILILVTFSTVINLIFKIRDRFLSWQKGVIRW